MSIAPRVAATGIFLLGLLLAGCGSLSPAQRQRAVVIAETARSDVLDCQRADHCAQPSVFGNASAQRVLILDDGQDALLARLHMIRSARETIDLQTYIYKEDDAGRMVLRELVAAARRGVRVRMLLDQLSAMDKPETLAAVSGMHRNLAIKVYNPVFNKGRPTWSDFALASVFRFRQLNQRMHNKLLLVDGHIGLTGGRNYDDAYFDWSRDYNFVDRDALVEGAVTAEMAANFEAYWEAPESVPAERLTDVARVLLAQGVPALSTKRYEQPDRVREMQGVANDREVLQQHLRDPSLPAADVRFVADLPYKHRQSDLAKGEHEASTQALRDLVNATRSELIVQTPYLVLTHTAQRSFARLQQMPDPPRVIVSTSSLAGTDNPLTYALAFKYRRRYVQRLGFEMYELKPHPADMPISYASTGAFGSEIATAAVRVRSSEPVRRRALRLDDDAPLSRRAMLLRGLSRSQLNSMGVSFGLHAKSMVVDRDVAVIGTHNFDPRGAHFNTESALIIRDPHVAERLARHILRATEPENAWLIAPRKPEEAAMEDAIVSVSEKLPIFDLWPTRYATAFEFQPGPECPHPLQFQDRDFYRCYKPVGDFPEVSALGFKWWLTRLVTAFGAGMRPFL